MFLYFVPQMITGRDQIAGLGLDYVLDGRTGKFPCCQVTGAGPSGGGGTVFTFLPEDAPDELTARVNVHREQQVWRKRPGEGAEVWIGHWKDQLPTPSTLARREQLAGHWLELLDGQQWRIPMARGWGEADGGDDRWRVLLPQRLDLAADGRWINGPVIARYAPLWELCEAWLNLRCAQADARLPDGHAETDAAVLCLQANYRLGRTEAAMLGILSQSLNAEILDVLIDWPGWLAACKKKGLTESERSPSPSSSASGSSPSPPAGTSSTAGPAAATGATAPPAPTSPP